MAEQRVIGVGELNPLEVDRQTGKLHTFEGVQYVFMGTSEDGSDYIWNVATEQDILVRDKGNSEQLQ